MQNLDTIWYDFVSRTYQEEPTGSTSTWDAWLLTQKSSQDYRIAKGACNIVNRLKGKKLKISRSL